MKGRVFQTLMPVVCAGAERDVASVKAFEKEMADLPPDPIKPVDNVEPGERKFSKPLRRRVLMGLGLAVSSIVLIIASCSDRDSDSPNEPARTETGADCTDETIVHKIKDGDTYWTIAEADLGKTPSRVPASEAIRDLNPGQDAGELQIDDMILIPADLSDC